ncbi:MAG: 3-dehydroquinate synthase [Candidatus Shikimatogenerans bostrichidophilus]|nr:MAG: 3-dehydroquinate synthase [Candidatus Shikimatogenerans bostrichidophilus]
MDNNKIINNVIINNNLFKLNFFLKKRRKIIILLDNNIKKFCLKVFNKFLPNLQNSEIKIIKIISGEKNKNLKTCIYIWKKMLKYEVDRSYLLINLGGGVITDLGGFVGSLFKRGLKFINIPTTLLSMIDASIGGKNGINFLDYKNELGVFRNPINIYINYSFLLSLPKKEILSGLGEILKYGLIYSKKYWNYIKKINFFNNNKINWKKIIYIAVKIKNIIVKKDPEELLGIRKILNFGHTIGHAIESLFLLKKKKITHGEAIALGMICESWISYKKNFLNLKNYKEITYIILKFFKVRIIKKKYFKTLLNYIKNDKKNLNNKIYFVLLKSIGKSIFNVEIKKKVIIKSIIIMNRLKNKNKKLYVG